MRFACSDKRHVVLSALWNIWFVSQRTTKKQKAAAAAAAMICEPTTRRHISCTSLIFNVRRAPSVILIYDNFRCQYHDMGDRGEA